MRSASLATPSGRASAWAWVLAAACALTVVGCDRHDVEECAPTSVVDEALVSHLELARASHHAADLRLGEVPEEACDERCAPALETLERFLAEQPPVAHRQAPEVREVRADTLARVGWLRMAVRGDRERALAAIDEGLALVPSDGFLAGHLLVARGRVKKAGAASALAEAAALGDDGAAERLRAEAARLRAEALDDLERAMELHRRVVDDAVGSGSPAGPTAAPRAEPKP